MSTLDSQWPYSSRKASIFFTTPALNMHDDANVISITLRLNWHKQNENVKLLGYASKSPKKKQNFVLER